MQKRSRKRKLDIAELAHIIVQQATNPPDTTVNGWANEGGAVPEVPPIDATKNPAAVAMGKLGGPKGGKNRWKGVSKAKRSAIAKKAARARWKSKKPPKP